MIYPQILLATSNQGKINEFRYLLRDICEECVPLNKITSQQATEPFKTFLENALNKANHAAKICNLPILSDDSGLIVPALQGEPGIFSSRYAKTQGKNKENIDAENKKCLLSKLTTVNNRYAYYFSVLVFIDPLNIACPIVADACWHGEIINEERGTHGFGYDPIFYLPEIQKTVAELKPIEKNSISHRAQAIDSLKMQLKKRRILKR